MSYNQNIEVTPVHWKKFAAIYGDAWLNMWNQLATVKNEEARVSAVNGFMMTFTRAVGMSEVGAATMDESKVDEDVVGFIKPGVQSVAKSAPVDTGLNPSRAPPATGFGGEKKPYVSNGQPLQGDASEKQIATLERFATGKNREIKALLASRLGELDKADLSELTKDEASKLIDICFKKVNEQKAAKGGE